MAARVCAVETYGARAALIKNLRTNKFIQPAMTEITFLTSSIITAAPLNWSDGTLL